MVSITKKYLDMLFEKFVDSRIIVLGDMMLDRYLEGRVNRISPEAPVPVVEIDSEFTRLGGAANVAYNLYSLGATPIPFGIIGEDDDGKVLKQIMTKLGFSSDFLIIDPSRPTAVKTRIIADNQHVVRADRESLDYITDEIMSNLLEMIKAEILSADAIILEDYNKGMLIPELIEEVIKIARQAGKIITVDPKFDNFFNYKNVTLFKPNRKETEEAFGMRIDNEKDARHACHLLKDRIECENVLITLGEKGMCFLDSENKFTQISTRARKVHDVSGAGDTVISMLSLGLAAGANTEEAITLANFAAGVVCGEVGVVPITREKLATALHKHN